MWPLPPQFLFLQRESSLHCVHPGLHKTLHLMVAIALLLCAVTEFLFALVSSLFDVVVVVVVVVVIVPRVCLKFI